MKGKKLDQKGVNVEKWVVFTALLNLTVLELTTGCLEYWIAKNWILMGLALGRLSTLVAGVY